MSRLVLGIGAFALIACTDASPPAPRPAPALPVDGTARPGASDPLAPPTAFVRDPAVSEAAALVVIDGTGRDGICAATRAQDRVALATWFTEDFRGYGPQARPEASTEPGPGLLREIYGAADTALDAAGFVAAWWPHVAGFAAVERCRFKPFHFRLEANDARSAWAEVAVEVGGRLADGQAEMRRGTWSVRLHLEGDRWRLRGARTGPLEVVRGQPAFADVGDQVGVGLYLDPATRERAAAQTDRGARTSIGGLAALDWDHDGFEDLLSWLQGTGLTLFRNDGRGGFEATPDLLPAREVGHALLVLDLDGDGVDEVVTSEVVGCEGDVARLGLYRRHGAALEALTQGLPFAYPCGRVQAADLRAGPTVTYQHLAPADVDGDGDLDLFAAGYSGAGSFSERFNYFQADDGEANLLFLNEGGLRFREVGRDRGLAEQHYSYVAAWLDLDADGDLDLFVGNDYGADDVYLNDGRGWFGRALDHPLASQGWSMGAAVADLDGDGVLDLSVSRMYSTAGNRVVPLVSDRLGAGALQGALTAAAGNALYSGAAGWRDRAVDLGLDHAGWAWGQAAADLDDDGDPDLLVVNGMTSHRTNKGADY